MADMVQGWVDQEKLTGSEEEKGGRRGHGVRQASACCVENVIQINGQSRVSL